jgi:uncharacterized protein YjcR
MAKKEAHAQALRMFIESKGKTPLKDIAEAVGVSSLSVGRWHEAENWKEKIPTVKSFPVVRKRKKAEAAKVAPTATKMEPVVAIKAAPTVKARKVEDIVIRKKGLFNQAVKIFLESDGKITNLALSKKLKVSKTTIGKWKQMPQWSEAVAVVPEPVEAAPAVQEALLSEVAPPAEKAASEIGAITGLQDLVTLNERLRSMLQREFLTAAEIEHLSKAKLALLEAAEVYLVIVEGRGE